MTGQLDQVGGAFIAIAVGPPARHIVRLRPGEVGVGALDLDSVRTEDVGGLIGSGTHR
jgi:hypothetical protein